MPIRVKSSPALGPMAQRTYAAAIDLLNRNFELKEERNRRNMASAQSLAGGMFGKSTEYDEGGGAKGAGIGAAIPLILAPFTGGASLAFLPAATAAGGAIGAAVDKPSGPGAAAASRQKQGAISMAAPFAAGGMSALGGEGFGAGYDAARGGLGPAGPDTSVWPDQEPGAIDPSAPPDAAGGPPPPDYGTVESPGPDWPTVEEIQAMTPEQRDAIDPRINEVLRWYAENAMTTAEAASRPRLLDMRPDPNTPLPLFRGGF